MTGKRIFLYAAETALAVGAVFIFWYMLGVAELSDVRFGYRAALIGWAVLFFSEMGMDVPLASRLWAGPLLLCAAWLGIFSVVTMKGALGWLVTSETLNYYYFIGIGSAALLAAMETFGAARRSLRIPFLILSGLLVSFLLLSAFSYLGYYLVYDALFTTSDMIAMLLSNPRESSEFLLSHLGVGTLLALLAGCFLCIFIVMGLVVSAMRCARPASLSKYRYIMHGMAIIGSCILLTRYVPDTYPIMNYVEGRNHLTALAHMKDIHEANMKHFKLTGDEAERMPKALPGSVILVIGESENRDHMKAFTPSCKEDTTPWLTAEKESKNFYLFDNAYSNFPQTVEALSMFLTGRNQYNGKSVEEVFTIMDTAKAAGYTTYWISNQGESDDGVLSMIAASADVLYYADPPARPDEAVMPYLKEIPAGNNFIVIHLYGSHDRYKDRVSESFKAAYPDTAGDKIKQYDLTIQYTDSVLEAIYKYGKEKLNLQAMLYAADHSDDMVYFHGGGARFTYDMVRIPFFIYLSDAYQTRYPETGRILRAHEKDVVTNDLVYDVISGILHAKAIDYDPAMDISSPSYALTKEKALTKHGMYNVAGDPLGIS